MGICLVLFDCSAHLCSSGHISVFRDMHLGRERSYPITDEILENAQTSHSASPAVHEIVVFRSGYTSSHSHGNVERFLSLRPTSSSIFVAFCFLIAVLSGVRQDLECSFDSSFPNEPKEVGFSVIYWPTLLLHLKSACSFHLLIYCIFCIFLGVQFFMF